jgi:hypothetical protein
MDDVLPTSEETLPSIEPIDEQLADESVGVRTSMVIEVSESLDNESLPILNEIGSEVDAAQSLSVDVVTPVSDLIEEQPIVDKSIAVRNLPVEGVMSMSEILGKPLVRMPLLNEITDAFPKGILIKSSSSNFDPPLLPPPKPPDQNFPKIMVELPMICNLMLPPPPPKPPYAIHRDVDFTVWLSGVEIVGANRIVIKTELLMDSNHCILREDLVDENRYDNSILEFVFVPFNALILYVKCSESFTHQVPIYIFQVWNAYHVFDVMPKMVVVCLNSINVGFTIAGVFDETELLSNEFVSRYCVVGVIQFIYAVYDQLRWITCYGYVYRVLISKKRNFIPCLKLSQSVMNSNISPNAHHYSSWLCELNGVYGFCNIKGVSMCKCFNGFEPMFLHEWKMLEWFDGYVTMN